MTLPNLVAVQQALGVELPESYVSVLEEFGLAGVQAYRFLNLNQLSWFEDHPLSAEVPYEGKALVIGEDLAGNAIVLLGFSVAGKPVLSDEVYLIDREVGEPEELAMDLLELLEEVGGVVTTSVETLWETAFEIQATRSKAIAALEEAMEARGYSESIDVWDGAGAHLRANVFGDGPVVIWLRAEEATLWLARRMAMLLERPIKAFEVVLRDELLKDEDDEQSGFPIKARRLDVRPDGTMADRDTGIGELANAGDAYETAMSVLWELVDRGDLGQPQVLEFFRAAPPESLSPRLVGLLTAIGESDAVDMTEIAGQRAVRIELPDGTRQISVVSDAELTALREHTDLP